MKGISTILRSIAVAAVGLAPAAARADVFSNVAEASGFSLVYTLPVPAFNASFDNGPIPYTVDNSSLVVPGSFTRVAYYLELAGSADSTRPNGFVYVSFDSPAVFGGLGSKIGVPSVGPNGSGVATNTTVTNMNVFSNSGVVTTGTGFSDGKIEFWPSNYGGSFQDNDGGFDGTANPGDQHGSMQIHHTSPYQTLFGYSDWGGNNVGSGNNPSELGIGTNTGGGFNDWTFSDSGTTYTVRSLQILVNAALIPEPASLSLLGLGGLALLRRRR
jgi:hypothetical protein